MIRKFFDILSKSFRKKGSFSSLFSLLVRIFYIKGSYYVYNVPAKRFPDLDPLEAGLEIKQVHDRKIIEQFETLPNLQYPLAFYLRLYDRHSICFAAYKSGKLVGFSWISPRSDFRLLKIWCDVDGYNMISHSVYIAPEARGLRLAKHLRKAKDEWFFTFKQKNILGFINAHNTNGILAQKKLGNEFLGMLVHKRYLFFNQRKFYPDMDLSSNNLAQ